MYFKPFPVIFIVVQSLIAGTYIERLGTGTLDILRQAKKAGLKEPDFEDDGEFRIVVYRKTYTGQVTLELTPDVTPEVTPEVERLVLIMNGEMIRVELQEILSLKDEKNFRENYIQKAIKLGMIEMTVPEKPKSRNQKYRLTESGRQLKKGLEHH